MSQNEAYALRAVSKMVVATVSILHFICSSESCERSGLPGLLRAMVIDGITIVLALTVLLSFMNLLK